MSLTTRTLAPENNGRPCVLTIVSADEVWTSVRLRMDRVGLSDRGRDRASWRRIGCLIATTLSISEFVSMQGVAWIVDCIWLSRPHVMCRTGLRRRRLHTLELCKKMVWKSIHSACTIFRISARNIYDTRSSRSRSIFRWNATSRSVTHTHRA